MLRLLAVFLCSVNSGRGPANKTFPGKADFAVVLLDVYEDLGQ